MLNTKVETYVKITEVELVELVNYCLKKGSEAMEQFPPHLNIKQLSRYLNYSEATIYKMVGHAEIPCYKISGKLIFKKSEIDDWLFNFQQPTLKTRISLLESNDK